MRAARPIGLASLLIVVAAPAWAGPISLAPPSLSFPDTGVGACSPPQKITLTNSSQQMATIAGVGVGGAHAAEFQLALLGGLQPPLSMGPGVSFAAEVTFCPQAGGARTATLTAQVAGGLGDATATLAGKAIGQRLTVSPSPIQCGGARLNDTTSTDVTISNAGGGTVKVTAIAVTGADASEFTLGNLPKLPASLGPAGQGAFKVTIAFKPGYAGASHSARLELQNDDPNLGPMLPTPISGYGGDPRIATSVGTMAFGNVRVGLESAPNALDVQNLGNSGLKISMISLEPGPGMGANPASFVLDRSAIPDGTIIPAMGQLPIRVSFKPSGLGPTSARVAIVSDDANTPVKYVTLLGSGTQAVAAAAPARIDFGVQPAFFVSPPSVVSFTNAGDDSYAITRIDIMGPHKDWFRVNGIVTLPLKVAPGNAVKVDLVALPLGVGPGAATATFVTDDAKTPQLPVQLLVNGTAATVALMPPSGDFGMVGVGTRKTMGFTLKNIGTDVLKLEDFQLVDPRQCGCLVVENMPTQDQDGNWPALKPGELLTFRVVFAPQGEGLMTGQIQIDTSDPMQRHIHVPLDGQGGTAALRLDPVSHTFPSQLVGTQSAPQNIRVENTGLFPFRIASVTLSGAAAGMFLFEAPAPFDLGAGQARTLTLSYAPVSAGSHSASLVVTPEGFPPSQVKVSGSAVQPLLQVATGQAPPNVLDFDALNVELLVNLETDGQNVGLKVPANGVALAIDHLTLTGSPDFRIDPVLMPNLGPGQTTTFSAYFRPTEVDKTKTATVGIFVRGVANPIATVTLKGTGVPTDRGVVWPSDGCSMAPDRASRGTAALLALALPGALLLLRRRRRQPIA